MNKPWVIVEGAGTDEQREVVECASFRVASNTIKDLYFADELGELGVDIMKRCPDGTLTTEY